MRMPLTWMDFPETEIDLKPTVTSVLFVLYTCTCRPMSQLSINFMFCTVEYSALSIQTNDVYQY